VEEEKPCCAAAAARKIRKVKINDQEIGIARLDEIMARVRAMNLGDEEAIGRALMKDAKIYNYIPASKETDYKLALMREYARRGSNGE